MKNLVLGAALLAGCASTQMMKANCAYKLGSESSKWSAEAPTAACAFEIQAEVGKAKDAQMFADAWQKMFSSAPLPPGIVKPPTMEVKKGDQ